MIDSFKRLRIAAVMTILGAGTSAFAADPPALAPKARQIIPFDGEWRFSGALTNDVLGVQNSTFNDAKWRKLDLPHDWAIEGQPDNQTAGSAGAFLGTGIGYYRKTFSMPTGASAGKRVSIEFDGAMEDSTVWINSQQLGVHNYGYNGFRYDLTGKLNASNTVTVRLDNPAPNARWYAGAGINRHVRLIITDAVHIEPWATAITTPGATHDSAKVEVNTSVVNEWTSARDVSVEVELFGPDGKSLGMKDVDAKSIAAGKSAPFSAEVEVNRPEMWDFETPVIYHAVVRVSANKNLVDDEVTPFGIRTIEFKPETGFYINGVNKKLYGVCLHADGGGVGTAVPMGIWERRLRALKELGVNAIRTAHNAPDPEFLNLCDRMGFAVMHEMFDTWVAKKDGIDDYSRFFRANFQKDIHDTLMQDRNHPCIVIYSAGNEIRDTEQEQLRILTDMMKVYHEVDPTRPVTQALFRPENGADRNGHGTMLDVVGFNYRPAPLVQYRQAHPEAKIIGTEDNYLPSELETLRNSPALAGEFLWAGVDYLGEGMKAVNSIGQGFGLFDRTLQPRSRAYERQSWWTVDPVIKIARRESNAGRGGAAATGPVGAGDVGGGQYLDWTPDNQGAHHEEVTVYSNCDTVELFQNNQSVGSKDRPTNWGPRLWELNFIPGTLRAVGRNKGKIVAQDTITTAGKATKIKLTADQPSVSPAWDDVVYVRAAIVDDKDLVNPTSNDKVTFKIDGPGVLAAVDNADLFVNSTTHEPFRGNERSAYRGTCLAVIRGTGAGKITVTATVANMPPATVTIEGVGK